MITEDFLESEIKKLTDERSNLISSSMRVEGAIITLNNLLKKLKEDKLDGDSNT
jgi:hypothetical protein